MRTRLTMPQLLRIQQSSKLAQKLLPLRTIIKTQNKSSLKSLPRKEIKNQPANPRKLFVLRLRRKSRAKSNFRVDVEENVVFQDGNDHRRNVLNRRLKNVKKSARNHGSNPINQKLQNTSQHKKCWFV